MFLDEARVAGRLNHPNIIQTDEVGHSRDRYYIVMEYLEGVTLGELMAAASKTERVSREAMVWLVSQALAGCTPPTRRAGTLASRSRSSIATSPPQNILVTYDGAVKVLDFGIAKAADSSSRTATGVFKGKLRYMSPEQATKEPLDRRSDIFSMGIVLWQILARRRLCARS